ncbi:MAG: hypothetical protein JRN26_01930 [Nitrososphaerota archaeon]|jgi:hypothetical protein|nr:hypothetical protein [Nitrososphaerota archaeon]MDG6935636.1 hypothetical protein [Nitrososphaerota archaeon]MDG6944465.1 hypothetical protein [Nitrososphaerota archaeon]
MKRSKNVEVSGKVEVVINGIAFSTVYAQKDKIIIFINDPDYLKKIVKKARLSMKSISGLGKFSEYMNRMGIGLDIRDSKGPFLQLGFGAYSSLIKVKMSTKRLIELLV